MSTVISMTEACRRTGISSHTLRYYESAGLLKHVARSGAGRRVYRERDLQWLEMLKILRGTGMSIRRIRQLAVMVEQGDASLEARIDFFKDWQAELRRQIGLRQAALSTIARKIKRHEVLLEDRTNGISRSIPCVTKP